MLNEQQMTEKIMKRVAEHIRDANVVLIAAGARMSTDGGIPDYHGGIQLAHPRLAKMGLNIYDLSNHSLFEQNPALAWGHWITRQREYLNTYMLGVNLTRRCACDNNEFGSSFYTYRFSSRQSIRDAWIDV